MTLDEIKDNNLKKLQNLIAINSKNENARRLEQISQIESEIEGIRTNSNRSLTPNQQLMDTYRISKLESDIARMKTGLSIEEYTKVMCEIRLREIIDKYLYQKPFTYLDVKFITEYLDAQDIKANTPKEELRKDIVLRQLISIFDFRTFTIEEIELMKEIEQKSYEMSSKQK